MDKYTRSDLACESIDTAEMPAEGSEYTVRNVGDFRIQTVLIKTEQAAQKIGKPCGRYLTVECGRFTSIDGEALQLLVRMLAGHLRGMAERECGKNADCKMSIFVAGLGNASLTADAIGPKVISDLTVTRHLREYEAELYQSIGCCALSAIAPGVLGQTGIETLEIIRGAVRSVQPDIAIIIDSLAARSCDRLASTIQISNAGITPGSGVGNHRMEISKQTLGIPVIAIGIPTVVNSSTLVYDALEQANLEAVDDRLRSVLENGRSFFVSPKDSDLIVECASSILSKAIGTAFTPSLL